MNTIIIVFSGVLAALVLARLGSAQNAVQVSFQSESLRVSEDAGYVDVQLTSSGAYTKPFNVSFTCVEVVPIEAEGDVDFISGLHTVTFDSLSQPETLSTTARIQIFNDNVFEETESFICVLLRPRQRGVVVKNPVTLRVSIEDDDTVQVSFQSESLRVSEDAGYVDVQLTSSGAYTKPFDVSFICIEVAPVEAQGGVDFSSGVHTVPFGFPDDLATTSTTARIQILNDDVFEETESFICTILRPRQRGVVVKNPRTLQVSIEDDDTVQVSFQSESLRVSEDAGYIDVQLTSSGAYTKQFNISFTCVEVVPIEADGGVDFGSDVHTVSFGFPDDLATTSTTARIEIFNDDVFEKTESFICVILRPRQRGVVVKNPVTLKVSIEDDDIVQVSFQSESLRVSEDAGYVDVQLTSSGAYAKPFDVSFTCIEVAPVEAQGGVDFSSGVHTVTFGFPGQEVTASTSAQVRIFNDALVEKTESFICIILRPFGEDRIVVKDPATLQVSIEDDDDWPECSFAYCRVAANRRSICQLPSRQGGAVSGCTGVQDLTTCGACYYSKSPRPHPQQCQLQCEGGVDQDCIRDYGQCVRSALPQQFRKPLKSKKAAASFKCFRPVCVDSA